MSKSKPFSLVFLLDSLKVKDISKVKNAVSNINNVYKCENKLLQQYMSRCGIVIKNPKCDHKNKTRPFSKICAKTAQKHEIMLRYLMDQILQCLDIKHNVEDEPKLLFTSLIELKNNIMEKELTFSSEKLKEIRNQAEIESNIYLKQILNYADKIKSVQAIIDEFHENSDAFKNEDKFDQWLIKQVKHNQYIESKISCEISDYKQHTGIIKKEISKLKLLPPVKPIKVISAKHEIEHIENEKDLLMQDKLACMKKNFIGKRMINESKKEMLDQEIEDKACRKELAKLKEKMKHLEDKLVSKTRKLKTLDHMIQAEQEDEKKNGPLFPEMITFCGLIAQSEQIRKNNAAIKCLKKKIERNQNLTGKSLCQ